MTERKRDFPDKKIARVNYDDVTKFIQEGQRLSKEARVGQEEATWFPHPEYPNLPIALLLASDIHYGSKKVDYDTLNKHFKIVEDTPNFYIATNGDHIDNFSPAVFPSGMMDDPISPHLQAQVFLGRMLEMDKKSKVAFMAQGNHDNFMEAAGYDFYQTFMGDFNAPILDNGGIINMVTQAHNYRLVVTHRYWGKSKLNITNSPKRLLEYEGGGNCDLAWTGHTHQSSLEHFTKGDRDYLAVVSGTYKKEDPWAARAGYSLNRAGQPGITVLFYPHERKMQAFKDVEVAQQHMLGRIWQEHEGMRGTRRSKKR